MSCRRARARRRAPRVEIQIEFRRRGKEAGRAAKDLAHLEFASARRLDYLRSLRRRGVAHRFAFFFAAFAATFGFAAAFDFDCADAFDFAATFNFVAPSSETRTRF